MRQIRIVENRLLLIAELNRYTAELESILSRFCKSSNSVFIQQSDIPRLYQYVKEIFDLVHDTLGTYGNYAKQIAAEYQNGTRNFSGTASYRCVENIISLLKALLTRLNRKSDLSLYTSNDVQAGTKVFIGHGHSKEWKDLKDFIHERMRLPWDEFNRVTVAGVPNTVRLAVMLDSAAIAFLVLTAEDETGGGKLQARMNVVHEVGLFQGRLGFNRAIVMLEEGCEEFTNITGLGQLRFSRNNIKAAFHEVQLVLEREGLIESPPGGISD